MKYISPTFKGLIAGVLMIMVSFGIYYLRGNFENQLTYITYFIYIGGIIWTLLAYKNSPAEKRSFKDYFTQGFKFFIVVTFLMVAFTWVFFKIHPELKDAMAVQYREDLLKTGNKTPQEIDNLVTTARQYYITMFVSMAIFGYLLIGALVTVIAAAFLGRQTKA